MTTAAQQIRDLVASDTILMPGVYDALTARIAARIGFDIVFISGYSVSAARLGEPDFGFLTESEMADAARSVTRVSNAPVIVDADTGYGNAVNVMRTVTDFQDAGAAGVFLEDQVWPKKCGHFQGKQVIPTAEHAAKIRAAADARGERDLFIVARTDARQPLGVDEAIERCLAYKEAGADALFVEAPQSVAELEQIAQALPPPLVANMIERGVTPHLSRTGAEGPRLPADRVPAGRALRRHEGGAEGADRAEGQGDDRRAVRRSHHLRRVRRARRTREALRRRGGLRDLTAVLRLASPRTIRHEK